MLPIVAALVVALNGSPMLLVAFGNISDFGAMPSKNLDDDVMWRAIINETLQNIAYAGIIRWELATVGVLLAAAVSWIGERDGGSIGAGVVGLRACDGTVAVRGRIHRDRRRVVPNVEVGVMERA